MKEVIIPETGNDSFPSTQYKYMSLAQSVVYSRHTCLLLKRVVCFWNKKCITVFLEFVLTLEICTACTPFDISPDSMFPIQPWLQTYRSRNDSKIDAGSEETVSTYHLLDGLASNPLSLAQQS